MTVYIILVEPENSGNIGASARVMANFRFNNLVLVNPKCEHLNEQAKKRAKQHGKKILLKAKVLKKLPKLDYLVATTSQTGSDYNIPRTFVFPEQLTEKNTGSAEIGLVFGRESSGLTNAELLKCDFTITVPAAPEYPTLNLSHSVAIILYELFKKSDKQKIAEKTSPISVKEKEQIMKMFEKLFNRLKFSTKEKKETQNIVWKRIIGKAMLSKREAYAVMGLLRKIIQ